MRRTIHRSPGRCAFFVWSWPLRVLALRRGQAPQALRRFGSPAFEAVPDPSGPGNAAATLPRGRLSGWSTLVRSESRQLAHEGATPPSTARVVPALGRGRLSGRFALVRSESRHSLTRGPPLPRPRRLRLRHGADEGGPVSVASEFGSQSEAEPSERSDYRPTEERAGSPVGRALPEGTRRTDCRARSPVGPVRPWLAPPAAKVARQRGWPSLDRAG